MSTKRALKTDHGVIRVSSSKNVRKKAADAEKEISSLNGKLEKVNSDLDVRNANYEKLLRKIIANSNCELYDFDETTNVFDLDIDDVLEMLSAMCTSRDHNKDDTIEVRVEELETRVTKQSMDIAKLTKHVLRLQASLYSIDKADNLQTAKQIASDAVCKSSDWCTPPIVASMNYYKTADGSQVVGPTTPRDILNNINDSVDVPRPEVTSRASGSTHINNMNQQLRYLIIRELSFTRTSGADWRLLAERVGINCDVIQRLKEMHVQYPMAKVLSIWGKSSGATVRMLHRHLISPQMRFLVLAKHVSDHYLVD